MRNFLVGGSSSGSGGRVVDAAKLLDPASRQASLDQLVSQEREDPASHEQRPRVAVPINARGAAAVIDRLFGLRGKRANLFEVQGGVAKEEDRSRSLHQMPVPRAPAKAYWQAKGARIFAVRFVEESVTAKLALRSVPLGESVDELGRFFQPHRSEVQVGSVGTYNHRV